MQRQVNYFIQFGIYLVLSTATVSAMEIVANRDVAAAWQLMTSNPQAALVSAGIVLSCILLVDGFVGWRYVGFVFSAAIFVSLAYLSSEKLRYLSEPLYPWDFLFTKQIVDLLPALLRGGSSGDRLTFTLIIVAVLGAGVSIFALSRMLSRLQFRARLYSVAVACLCLGGLGWMIYPSQRAFLISTLGIQNYNWVQAYNYKTNGFALGFLLNLNNLMVFAPRDYTADKMKEVGAAWGNCSSVLPVRPNVVVIMSEAFWDPTLLPGVKFSQDPMPFVRDPGPGARRGWLFSPQQAGGTANVEFEALTGFSNAFLPNGSVPYQQYIHRSVNSLPDALREIGYKAIAVHPYHKWFWNRSSVYKHFDFDEFIGLEELGELPKYGPYASDQALMDSVLGIVKREKGPLFLFAVTMQNHGPYKGDQFGGDEIRADGRLSEGQRSALGAYARGISRSDAALRELINGIDETGEPTLVIFFGDHLPYLGPGNATFKAADYIASNDDLTTHDYVKMRKTPFLVWSNFEANIPEFGVISPAIVPYIVASTLGVEHPNFTGRLGDVFAEAPVLDRRIIVDSGGKIIDKQVQKLPRRIEETLHRLSLYQYDSIFGEQIAEQSSACQLKSGG